MLVLLICHTEKTDGIKFFKTFQKKVFQGYIGEHIRTAGFFSKKISCGKKHHNYTAYGLILNSNGMVKGCIFSFLLLSISLLSMV